MSVANFRSVSSLKVAEKFVEAMGVGLVVGFHVTTMSKLNLSYIELELWCLVLTIILYLNPPFFY